MSFCGRWESQLGTHIRTVDQFLGSKMARTGDNFWEILLLFRQFLVFLGRVTKTIYIIGLKAYKLLFSHPSLKHQFGAQNWWGTSVQVSEFFFKNLFGM